MTPRQIVLRVVMEKLKIFPILKKSSSIEKTRDKIQDIICIIQNFGVDMGYYYEWRKNRVVCNDVIYDYMMNSSLYKNKTYHNLTFHRKTLHLLRDAEEFLHNNNNNLELIASVLFLVNSKKIIVAEDIQKKINRSDIYPEQIREVMNIAKEYNLLTLSEQKPGLIVPVVIKYWVLRCFLCLFLKCFKKLIGRG